MKVAHVFAGIAAPCCWSSNADKCVCSDDERTLRAYASGAVRAPMTAEQLAWCSDQAVWFGEGSRQLAESAALSDRNLAASVLMARSDYVTTHC